MSAMLLGWLTFLITAGSPGPSVLAIMGASLAHGRGAGLGFATGVVTGSVFWGLCAAFGVGLLLQTFGWALTALKLAGGLYLLWMAWKAAKSALRGATDAPTVPRSGFYAAGLALHLTNPKAVFGWTAVVAVGLPPGGDGSSIPMFLLGCAVLAVVVNHGYALVFSTGPLVRLYQRARRWVEVSFAAVFASAGVGLLAWRP